MHSKGQLSVISIVLMRYVFNTYGFEKNLGFIVKFVFNPLIIISLVTAISCRFLFYSMFRELSMTQTFFVTQVSAIFILFAGYLIFHDTLTKKQIIGAIMILFGAGLI